MSQANKMKKPKGPESVTAVNKTTKTVEVKMEHSNKNSDKTQPTAEQMRIAQIIDTKPEDPSLKDKVKQVMDATQKSEDEAYLALHDSDHDLNRAVNLLLEGGTQDEWSTSSKKKKPRAPNEKGKEFEASDVIIPATDEDWGNCSNFVAPSFKPTAARSRSRPFNKSSGRGTANRGSGSAEHEKPHRPNRNENGPSRGGRSFRGGRQGPRGGFRGRGGSSSLFRRPIETWGENKEIPNHQNASLAVGIEDWDSEEYTGSLANSQVFTPSSTTESNSLPGVESVKLLKEDNMKEITSEPNMSGLSSQMISHFNVPPRPLQQSPPSNKTMMPEVNSGMNQSDAAPTSMGRGTSTIVSALCGLPKSEYMYSVGRGRGIVSSIGLMNYAQASDDVRLGRLNSSVKAKPRIPPPSKIPSSAVEMPPEVESAIGLLDVQFGALEFGELSEIIPSTQTSSHATTPSPSPADNLIPPNDSILSNDSRSFSPSPGTGSNSLTSQLADVSPKMPETTSSSLYQDNVYQTSLYTKPSPAVPSIYNSTYNNQILTSNNIIYSSSSTSTYASSSVGSYGNASYPYQYPSYPISQATSLQSSSSNTFQNAGSMSGQHYGNSQSVYGTSSLGTSSYSGYPSYNSSSQHNHKSLSSSASNNKEFESTSSGTHGSISHSMSMSGTTLLSSTQTTPATKPTSASSMAKGAVVTNIPAGVPPMVGTPQYIMGQGGVPYFPQPPVYYEDLQIMPQQRLPHHITAGYYEMGYQPTTTREGVQFNISDGRFARADTTSPVQVSSINQQQSGTPAHQQPLMNPTAMPPYAAYFYGGSMIPSNFQFGTPTLYPVAATGSNTGHGSTSSGVYGKGPNYAGNYGGIYESGQQNVGDYKSSPSQVPKVQPTQSANPSTSSDISTIIYSKSHSALSKTYDKPGFHCPTPPPYNLSSQNSGIGPAGGYQPLFIPTLPHHHNTTMMHQPMHQDTTNSGSGRSQVGSQQNKVVPKSNYSTSNYWAQN